MPEDGVLVEVNERLERLAIPYRISVLRGELPTGQVTLEVKLTNVGNNLTVSIADVGFGVSVVSRGGVMTATTPQHRGVRPPRR